MEEKKNADEKASFRVSDKRHFTKEGDVLPEEAAPAEAPAKTPEEKPLEKAPEAEPPPRSAEDLPKDAPKSEEPLDFAHLVSFLATNALFQLGEVTDPISQKREVNLEAASQMIDFLAILHEKTKGNLQTEEVKILEGTLTELRSRFLRASGFVK